METVEVVIKIPEKTYRKILSNEYDYGDMNIIIQAGTPLPKGHGRIIDESRINKCEQAGLIMKNGDIVRCLVTDAPIIIEKARDKDADSD